MDPHLVYKFVPCEFRTFYDEIIKENVAGASSQSEEKKYNFYLI